MQKHSVTLPDFTTATRNSKNRTYPFAVAVGPIPRSTVIAGIEADIARQEQTVAARRATLEYLRNGGELVETQSSLFGTTWTPTGLRHERDFWVYTDEDKTADPREVFVARYERYVADGEKYLEENLRVALAAAKAGPDLVGGWHVTGWQSRPDLAEKERARVKAQHPTRKVIVLETTIA